MDCKNTTIAEIEEYSSEIGPYRTQDYFSIEGRKFTDANPKATIQEYFKHFGYNVNSLANAGYKDIGSFLTEGNPYVIIKKSTSTSNHSVTLTQIRQWREHGPIRVWYSDPFYGTQKARWSTITSDVFFVNGYVFIIK